jgi:hypothetical protein
VDNLESPIGPGQFNAFDLPGINRISGIEYSLHGLSGHRNPKAKWVSDCCLHVGIIKFIKSRVIGTTATAFWSWSIARRVLIPKELKGTLETGQMTT